MDSISKALSPLFNREEQKTLTLSLRDPNDIPRINIKITRSDTHKNLVVLSAPKNPTSNFEASHIKKFLGLEEVNLPEFNETHLGPFNVEQLYYLTNIAKLRKEILNGGEGLQAELDQYKDNLQGSLNIQTQHLTAIHNNPQIPH